MGMKATSRAAEPMASTSSPELETTRNSTGTPSWRANSFPRSTVTPRGSPPATLTTKKADCAGAETTPTRSFPVGAASSRCDFVGPSEGEALSATAAKRRAEKNGKSFMDILLYTDFIDDSIREPVPDETSEDRFKQWARVPLFLWLKAGILSAK